MEQLTQQKELLEADDTRLRTLQEQLRATTSANGSDLQDKIKLLQSELDTEKNQLLTFAEKNVEKMEQDEARIQRYRATKNIKQKLLLEVMLDLRKAWTDLPGSIDFVDVQKQQDIVEEKIASAEQLGQRARGYAAFNDASGAKRAAARKTEQSQLLQINNPRTGCSNRVTNHLMMYLFLRQIRS